MVASLRRFHLVAVAMSVLLASSAQNPSQVVSAYNLGRVPLINGISSLLSRRRPQPQASPQLKTAPVPAESTGSRPQLVAPSAALALSGGADVTPTSTPFLGNIASAWGALGVMYILLRPLKTLLPIALLPFEKPDDLKWWGWAMYALWTGFMGYTEGYKAFQKKFSPMVVTRALTLRTTTEERPKGWWLRALFAPFYSMGLFHASKKRLIVSWSFIFGIGTIVAIVKRLPYPWRSVVDGGVVLGLSWGAMAIASYYFRSIVLNRPPNYKDY